MSLPSSPRATRVLGVLQRLGSRLRGLVPDALALDRPLSRRQTWIVVLAIALAGVAAGLTGIREFDQWFHMAWGRAFLREGFPAHDFFLFTYRDLPAPIAPEWLGSVVIYLSWWLGGDAGTVLLVGLMVGLTAAILLWDGLDGGEVRWFDVAVTLIVVVLAIGVVRRRAVARPEILCYPLLAWTLLSARRWVEGRGRAILAFPLVALVWSNVHLTVLYGLGTVFAFALEALLRGWWAGPGAPGRRRGLLLAGVGVAGSGLAFVHPTGGPVLLGLRYGLDLMGIRLGPGVSADVQKALDLAHGVIFELRPPSPDSFRTALGGLLVVVAVGVLLRWRRPQIAEIFLVAVAVVFGLRAQRFLPLFAIVAAAATARNLRAALSGLRDPWRSLRWALVPIVPAAVIWTVVSDPFPLAVGPMPEIFPKRAADVLVAGGAGSIPGLRVYETFHFGGYLEWKLDAPVIYNDGRLLWPPGDAEIAMQAAGSHDLARLDSRWRFDALVLDQLRFESISARLSVQSLTWDPMADRSVFGLVAIDDGAFLYVRRDGKLAYLLEREYRAATPSRVLLQKDLEDAFFVTQYRREWARAVMENPSCLLCNTGLYLASLAAGDPDAAERIYPGGRLPGSAHPLGNGSLDALHEGLRTLGHLRAVEGLKYAGAGDSATAERLLRISALASETAKVRDALGRLKAGEGELVAAEREYRRAIELDPSFSSARAGLGLVLERAGRPSEARKAYEGLLEVSPGSRDANVARERLADMNRAAR